ncbi:MAG: hypothetical protein IPM48_08445 [Saprospiraceae bacterium]|nr:hypothetical protein [Saprospiraceae bacterium]
MKTLIFKFNFFAFFTLLASAVLAQYDDVYYDPSRVESRTYTSIERENYSSNPPANPAYSENTDFEDEYSEYDDQEYHYSSRIRRFHRGYYTRDFYDPFYTNIGFYDPWLNDPFLWGNSIVFSYGNFYSPWRFNRFNQWRWGGSYWGYWNWNNGFCPNYFGGRWGGWYDPWWYGNRWGGGWYDPWCYNPGFNTWGYNGYGNWGGNGWRHWDWRDRNDRYHENPKGRYYGSRNYGSTTTSRSGPVRVRSTDPHQDHTIDPSEKTTVDHDVLNRSTDRNTNPRFKSSEVDQNNTTPAPSDDLTGTRRVVRKTDPKEGTETVVPGGGADNKVDPSNEDRNTNSRKTIRFRSDRYPTEGSSETQGRDGQNRRSSRYWPESPQDRNDSYQNQDSDRSFNRNRSMDTRNHNERSRSWEEPNNNSRMERSAPSREPSFRNNSPRMESSPRSSNPGRSNSSGAGSNSSGGSRRSPR